MPLLTLNDAGFSRKDIDLSHISFSVDEGEHVTITGPSGSGKSTLLKLVAGLIPLSSGEIIFQEKNIHAYDPINYRKEVSYCYQNPVLFGETVRDNLAFPYQIRKESFNPSDAARLLEAVGLNSGFLDTLVKNLSGGEKQRIGLLRHLLFTPKILLLDEITSALDNQSRTLVRKLITDTNHNQGVAILEVTHNDQEIANASRLITISHGRMAGSNEPIIG